MIFKTFNSDIDKSTSKIGMFNKSFWAMRQDLKHGNGIGFSIFGGQGVTSKDKQSILDLSTALKNGMKPAKAWATTMKNCSEAAKNQARQCLKTKGDLTQLANGLKVTTKSAKAAEIGLKALSIAGNMLVMWGISKAIELFSAFANASNELRESAEQLGNTFSSIESDINDYKTQISDLYKVINDNTSSYEDTYTARQNLLSIQDEMIEKFGKEAEAVSLITEAVNGSTEALDRLTLYEWDEIKNKFNYDSDRKWYKKFADSVVNFFGGFSNNFERMIDKVENAEIEFKMHVNAFNDPEMYKQFTNKLKEYYGVSIFREKQYLDRITISGNLNDVYYKLLEIKKLASDMGIGNNFLNDLSKEAEKVKNTLDKYEDIYNQHILYDKIFGDSKTVNENGETYEDMFLKITKSYKEYQEAVLSGDDEAIEKAKQNYARIVQESTSWINDDSVIDYFNKMYPDLQAVVGTWQFEVKFKAAVEDDSDDFENEVKDAVKQFNTVEDINNYNAATATDEQKYAYAKLNQVADDYNLTRDQLIDKLVRMGLLTSQSKEDLLKKLIPTESRLTAGVASVLEDSMEQVNPDVATEWVKGLSEEEAMLANSPEFDKALEKQKEKLNGAALSADNYSDALQEVKDSQNQIDVDKTDISFSDIFSLKDAENNLTDLGRINEEIDKFQSAYKGLKEAMDSYNETGTFTLDQVQEIISYGGDYLKYLMDENGNLQLNEEALNKVAIARINEMRAKALSNLMDNLDKITTEEQALSYLETQLLNTATAYDALTASRIKTWSENALENGISQETINKVTKSFENQVSAINEMFNNISIDSIYKSSSSSAAAADAEQATKDYIDSYMNYMEKSLETGRIDYQTYSRDVAKFLKDMYDQGKIAAKDYHDYTKQMLEVQKEVKICLAS